MEITTVKHRPRLQEFLFDLAKELGCYGEMDKSFRILKASLHALRDSIQLESAIQIQSCLPVFLKPVFQDGWKPFQDKMFLGANQDFVKDVCMHEGKMHHYDLPAKVAAERIRAVFTIIEKYVDPQRAFSFKEAYPNELRYILQNEQAA